MGTPEGELQELRQRIEELEQERESILARSRRIAEANARAALHAADRQQELEEQSQALAQALAEAETSARRKDEFVAKVSHELRTPLNGIMGMTQLLLETGLSDGQREFATSTLDSASSLLAIINDLLDFSRLSAKRVELIQESLDAWVLVEDVVRLLTPQAHARGLSIEAVIESKAPRRILGDSGRLRQILVNLCGNAVKFTESGGVLVRLSSGEREGQLRFDVEDTGPGIPNALIPRLFEPFEQVDNSASRKHGGTGLGLAICSGLADAMGAEIEVTSREGVGSTFTFWLPVRSARRAEEKPGEVAFDRCSLLVPQPGMEAVLQDHLGALGVCVRSCGSLQELLQEASDDPSSGRQLVLVADEALGVAERKELGRASHEELQSAHVALLVPQQKSIGSAVRTDSVLRLPLRVTELHTLVQSRPGQAAPTKPSGRRLDRIPGLAGMSVLLVEDNPVNQRVAKLMIQRLGCEVTVAENGRGCLESMAQAAPDVILMDCQMPVMNGYEATRLIRELPGEERSTPVIALTAHASAGDRARCLEAGMDDHLSKPINSDLLVETLLRWREVGGSRERLTG